MPEKLSRRTFLATGTTAASALALAGTARAQAGASTQSPNNRLNVAFIGVCGMGSAAVGAMLNENIVAFCDVDEVKAGRTYKSIEKENPEAWARVKNVARFNDYRKMFDALGNQIDAVTISTPDHMHFPAAMTAIALGKHVYCQKPLTHTIWEARELARAAREKGVITQMGNQGHAGDGCRTLKEWVKAGILGDVREIHSWTDRPGRYWPHVEGMPDHSKALPVGPPPLTWDAWLGVAKEPPYDPAYLPAVWRGWWEFGTGPFGDVGCHIMDGAYYALDLTTPTVVEAMASGSTSEGTPAASVVTMNFPARGKMSPVKYVWSDGGIQPVLPPALEIGRALDDEAGTLVIGSKATALCSFYYDEVRIIPQVHATELASRLPPKTIPRVDGGPFAEFIRACKGGPKCGSNFDYSGPFTEMVLLGVLAQRMQRRLEWDPKTMNVTNVAEANRFVRKDYRAGWM